MIINISSNNSKGLYVSDSSYIYNILEQAKSNILENVKKFKIYELNKNDIIALNYFIDNKVNELSKKIAYYDSGHVYIFKNKEFKLDIKNHKNHRELKSCISLYNLINNIEEEKIYITDMDILSSPKNMTFIFNFIRTNEITNIYSLKYHISNITNIELLEIYNKLEKFNLISGPFNDFYLTNIGKSIAKNPFKG